MRVQIDQARRDNTPGNIAAFATFEPAANREHFSILEGDIRHGVQPLRRIDDATAAQNEISHHVGEPNISKWKAG